ncbi:MAG: hypothetical protein AVDCRST_MAG56-2334 [uncultured Cytophagales bacterium]|uniref:Anti-sigma factor n=1 Tax=uncultured Cytophagales bacterium TaxID=158755 RepID=A0A6J4GZ28_9SPHI|nr:MAG: hypothetical protein AVDCRST_MAG56-2334 [uncultured Cytophagales bacterium]
MEDDSYTPEDFLANQHFLEWVQSPTPAHEHYWQNWLLAHPEHRAAVDEARQLAGLIRFRTFEPTQAEADEVWAAIERAAPKKTGRAMWLTGWRVAAAVALLVTALGGWFYAQRSGELTIRTAYAQQQTITLPDGSTVSLNANSTLRYNHSWTDGRNREVWLQGEAFFSVAKRQQHNRPVKFTVHTGQAEVEVLGTQFNVSTRREAIRVVLAEGKVRLRAEDKQELTLQPGDLAQLDERKAGFEKRRVQPADYSAWRENRVVFREATLREVAQALEDYFGYRVTLLDESLAGRQFQATLPADNVEVWLATLSRSFPVQIDSDRKQVVIGKPSPY